MAKAAGKNRMDSFLSLVVGGAAGFGLVVLTSRAWRDCGVTINSIGNGPTLLFVGVPVAGVVNIVLFSVVYRTSRRTNGGKFVMPFLAAAIAITIADLALFSWAGTPAGSAASLCPANVPHWWPTWIPT
jgi:hypothetical protein